MKHRPSFAIISAFLAMVLAVLACNGGAAAPTNASTQASASQAAATQVAAASDTPASSTAATKTPSVAPTEAATTEAVATEAPTEAATKPAATQGALSGSLDVHGIAGYLDEINYYRVDGLLTNGTDKPVSNVELSLQLTDSSGKSVLKDDNDNPTSTVTFNPILTEIGSGETTPFEYYFSTDGGDTSAWKADVKVDSSENFSDLQRVEVDIDNELLTVNSDGDVYLTGELVNTSDQPAQINDFAGALLDDAGAVHGTSSFQDVARLLAPAGDSSGSDRTPFVVFIPGPVPDGKTATYYIDGVTAKQADVDAAADAHLKLETSFVDGDNDVHVVATVSNGGTETMTVRVVAGLYAQDGKVLDGSSLDAPIDLGPGASVPVQLYYFGNLNGNPDLIDKVVSYTAQIDPYWTFPITPDLVTLTASNVTTTADGGDLDVKGDIVNDSGQILINATIVVIVHDADGNLVTSDHAYAENTDDIAANGTAQWHVTVNLPPEVDASTLKVETIVQGSVKSS